MNIINNGRLNKIRKGGIPSTVKNNKDFTFGVRSDNDNNAFDHVPPGVFVTGHGSSSMHKIMSHTENLMEELQNKIHIKQ
jgi:hypothetical protein